MAVAAYDTDLTSANSGLVDEALTVGNWDESSVSAWADGGTETAEGNFYISGTDCISAQFVKTGVGTLINDVNQFAGAFTVDTDGAILIWGFWASPASLATYANGGVRTVVGNTLGDFYAFKASGSDFEPNPFGGWYCYAIDPDTATADTTVGSPDDTWSHVGLAINATAQSRGNPQAVDAIRVGRCTMEVTAGQAADYGTFTGMASFDDSSGLRYGVFQSVAGGYRWQGLMSLGVSGTSVDFRDSNASIIVANTPSVDVSFNRIEIHNSSSNIEWSSVTINAYGVNDAIAATNSAGEFEVIDNATVTFDACTFIDMSTFIFNDGANSNIITNSTFQRCGLITTGAATFTGCKFDEITSASHVLAATPSEAAKISATEFISDGTGNGLEITGTVSNITLSDIDFTGYSLTVDADKAIYVNIATGSMTINISGGSGVTADSHVRTAGATVTVSADTTVTFTGMKDNTEVRVYENISEENTDISFTATNTIASAGSGFGDFAIDDIIRVTGSDDNDDNYTVVTASATTLTVVPATITTESAGASILVKKTNQVEISGIEDATAGSSDNRSYAWSTASGTLVDYVLHNWNAVEPFYQTIRVVGYSVPGANASVGIQQLIDRNAS